MRTKVQRSDQAVWSRLALIMAPLALALTLAFTGALLTAPRAHANGDLASLTITGSPPFVYGSSSGIPVQMAVTLGAPVITNTLASKTQTLSLSNGVVWGLSWVSTSADGLTLIFTGSVSTQDSNIPPGGYTATASYLNPDTQVKTTSNPVAFTLDKGPSATGCQIQAGMVVVGATFYIMTNLIDNTSGDTFTVTLSGPESISATLQTDLNQNLHMTAPTIPGTYTVTCAFAGNRYLAPSQATTTMSVHDNAHVAGMRLYTNPTTVTRGVPMTFYIVLQPASGYPAPTGYLTITMGILAYNTIPVGANGATLVQLAPLPLNTTNPFSQISIAYGGDSRYLNSSFNFPLTNPAIPGAAPSRGVTASGSSGKSGASATPTAPVASPTPIATATVVASPTPGPTTRASAFISPVDALLPWLSGGVGALILLGALAGGIAFAQRRKRARAISAQEPVAVADAAEETVGPGPDQQRAD